LESRNLVEGSVSDPEYIYSWSGG